MLVFNGLCVYVFIIYWLAALSNPGRIYKEEEKQHINKRYERLHLELIEQLDEIGELEQEGGQSDQAVHDLTTERTLNRKSRFEDGFDALLFNNSFQPADVINYKMRDNRELRYCDTCKVYKLPRMHHCSTCDCCCIKYDHHCGMLQNCIGVNNYHLFF